jgi:hypothetical protein
VLARCNASGAHGLRPHKVEQFKLSTDPKFVDKLRDVVGLYVDPPAHAIVLSVDEKSQIQALDRTQPGLPMTKGRAGTMTLDYKRQTLEFMSANFGKAGAYYYWISRGIDERPVRANRIRKRARRPRYRARRPPGGPGPETALPATSPRRGRASRHPGRRRRWWARRS